MIYEIRVMQYSPEGSKSLGKYFKCRENAEKMQRNMLQGLMQC